MSAPTATAMDAVEIAEFLGDRQTGVLSLAKDDDGYGIPVSFAYEDEGPYVYLRLGYGPDSQKRQYVDAADHVSFVVYDHTDEGWKSVVAGGPIEELSDTDLDATIVEAVHDLDIPFFRVHRDAAMDLEFTIARIQITTLSGIAAPQRT